MSRRTARKHIFNIVFQFEFNNGLDIDEVVKAYFDEFCAELTDSSDMEFVEAEVGGIYEKLDELDNYICSHSDNWGIDRISKVDLAILRIAAYEIVFAEDIPDKVAVNEAVELAKEFGEDKSFSFINGVLGKLMRGMDN